MPAKYTYQRLNDSRKEVRYLRILPHSGVVIQCSLENSPLDTDHICLSHRWTEKVGSREILIDDKPFALSTNLWRFLDVARHKYGSDERFWIDAICIDQQSISEKNKQVPLMGQIYSSAKLVVTWLGLGDVNTRMCVEAIRKKELRLNTNHFHHAVSAEDSFWGDFWDHMARFFENDYWKRAWVVQEVLLAAHGYMLIGDVELTWESLVEYWHLITRSDIAPQTHLKRLNDWNFRHNAAAQAWHQQPESASLRTLLARYGEQSCNDFHDRVYSLLALAKDRDRVKVDYRLSREQLFFDTLQACGTDRCFCLATCLLRILKLNALKAGPVTKFYRPGSWMWEKFTTDSDTSPIISFGINYRDTLEVGTGAYYTLNDRDAQWLRNLPASWKRKRGSIIRFLYTPVPAEFLLKVSAETGKWHCSGIRFHHGTTWTKHIESFNAFQATGIEVHTYERTNNLCCLRFTRSALLKLLLFGEQHTICEEPSFGGYEMVDQNGVLKCGQPIDKAWSLIEQRRRTPYRNPSTGSTPRPSTPSLPSTPNLSRLPSDTTTSTSHTPTPQRTPTKWLRP